MSEPKKDYDNPGYGAGIETISAMIALNMEPKPVENPSEDDFYLSETDRWAKHSILRVQDYDPNER